MMRLFFRGSMSQLPRMMGVACLIAALSASASAPALPAVYSWGSGKIRWRQTGSQVIGISDGGECNFRANTRVITATWVEDLLVGTIRICQSGPSCHTRDFPMFAFYNPADRSLSLNVLLDPGCGSLAVPSSGHLQLLPDTDDPPDPPPGRPKGAFLQQGERRLHEGHPAAALASFHRALNDHEDAPRAWADLGRAQRALGHLAQAERSLEHSLALRTDGNRYYELAKTQAELGESDRAMESLHAAVDQGFDDLAGLLSSKSLASLHGRHDFTQLVLRLRNANGSAARK